MPKMVLVADDDRSFRNVLQMIISKAGYQVITAENGREAYETACRETPALIISDATMPEMDGYEFCCKIRGTESVKDIPFLLVTGQAEGERPEVEVSGYVSKPPSKASLLESIQSLIGEP